MNWLTPLVGLYLALAVIPPLILLYFLKLRRKPQAIASTLLWQRSVEDLRANAPFQRLRKSLLLFLQLIALALLVAAVMQPQLQGGRPSGGRTVLMLDNSASMTSTDLEGRTRLEEAQQLARERVERLHGGGILSGTGGETMIVAFSDRAEIYSQFTDSKTQLLAAIDRIGESHGETVMEEALKLARAHTTNVVDAMGEARPAGDPATLELYSDGRIIDLSDQVIRGETLRFHPIGGEVSDNVGIAAISVERPFDAPTKIQVFVALTNFNETEVTCQLELSVNGDVPLGGVKDVTVGPASIDPSSGNKVPGRNNLVFNPFEQPRDAVIVIRNLRDDDLLADDIAQIVVPPAERLRIAPVDSRGFVLRTALEGLPLESLTTLTAIQFESLAEAGRLDDHDVYVLDDYSPEVLPPARYLCFGKPPAIEGLNVYGEPGNQQFILDSRDEHPVMRFVMTDNIFISRYQRMQPDDDVTVLALGTETPLIVEYARPPQKLVYVAFDPLDSNWPLERSFVTFIFNAIEYLGTSGEAVASEGLAPGDAITARLPENAREIRLRSPDGSVQSLDVNDPTLFSWGPVRLTGVYTVSYGMPGADTRLERSFAVNLLSPFEGDIEKEEEIRIGREEVTSVGPGGSRYTPLWPWAIGVCLVVLVFEWWVYNRKMYF